VRRSTSTVRRACAVGTTAALIGLTTGLGLMTATAATAAEPAPAPTQDVVPAPGAADDGSTPPSDTETGADAGAGTGTGSDADTGADTGTGSDADTGADTGTGSDADTGADTGTGADQGSGTESPVLPGADTTPPPAGEQGPTTPEVAPAPGGTVAIDGAAKVGVTLHARTTGFVGARSYAWTRDGDERTLSVDDNYTPTKDDIGHVITLSVSDELGAEPVSATTATITQDVRFPDSDAEGVAAPVTLTDDAGVAFDHSFAVAEGSGTITYSIGYADPEGLDADDDRAPEDFLPDGADFDPNTGRLTGTALIADVSEFTVIASNGTSTATLPVSITVRPDVAVGVLAFAQDYTFDQLFDDEEQQLNEWVILPDGSTIGIHQSEEAPEDYSLDDGNPTVRQGQSLWVSGAPVDQYGNAAIDLSEDVELPRPAVTSDVSTDQVAWDDDEGAARVAFPHASTHRLTVATSGVSVAFDVTVVPNAATVATVVPTGGRGQLAYTGTDATSAVPWAIGLVAAGAGLIGAGAVRRRRAQR